MADMHCKLTEMKKKIFLILATVTNFCLFCQGTWTQKADFTGGSRTAAVGFCIGNKCYMGTGLYVNQYNELNDFWEWDPITNVWTQKANFGGGSRLAAVAFSIGNKGYISCGTDGTHGPYNDLWEFDPTNNSWTQKASIPASIRSEAVGFAIGTKGYVGTGSGHGNILQDFWEWDQTTDTWTRKADYSGGSTVDAIAFSIGNKGYIGIGSDNIGYHKDFWEWDQGTNVWTQKANFPFAREFASAFSIGTKGYVGIGGDSTNSTKFWQWDQFTNIWALTTNFAGTPRSSATGFSNGTNGYIGLGGNWPLQDFWEFDPLGSTQIKEEQVISTMHVFPNPTANEITIIYTSVSINKLLVTVKNALGQTVYADNDTNFSGTYNKTVDLGNSVKGIYFVEIICGKDRRTNKIVFE